MVTGELSRLADSQAAEAMAAYLKTDMPFYGVKKPQREAVLRKVVADFPPSGEAGYRENVRVLWALSHREEKYLAIGYARHFKEFVQPAQLDVYQEMITDGAWWDLVDDIAIHLVGGLVLEHRQVMRSVLETWIDAEDLWLRRTALVCQVRHKEATDPEMLFDFCRRRAADGDFFIRKAIGWALRDYSKTDPHAVRAFLGDEGDLSSLSRREAARHL